MHLRPSRPSRSFKRFSFGKHEVRQILYADDITLFVKDTLSIDRLQHILDEFGKVIGLIVNKEKTNLLWMGIETMKNLKYHCLEI